MKKRYIKAIYCFAVIFGMVLSPVFSGASDIEEVLPQTTEEILPEQTEIQEVHVPVIEDFTDISEESWYYVFVKYLVENGIIFGTTEQTYSPDGTFTVAECCTIVTRYLGLDSYAQEKRNELLKNTVAGSELWYSGYAHTMLELGVLEAEEFGSSLQDEFYTISADNFEKPITRELFAHIISCSFELDGKNLKANNTYYERGGLGHEFITAGAYDKDSYLLYAPDIADYWSIEEPYRKSVLKAYYNGIFNGDNFKNFNPKNNLTRAEMSKVLSVILDESLRQRNEYRDLPAACILTESDYYMGAAGDLLLSKKKGKSILLELAKNVTASAGAGNITVTYTHKNILPEGYYAEVSLYGISENGSFSQLGFVGLNTDGAQNTPYELKESTAGTAQLLFVLRNTANDGRVENAITVNIANDASVSVSDLFYSAK